MSGGKGGSQATLYLRSWLKWGTGEGLLCMNHFPFSSENELPQSPGSSQQQEITALAPWLAGFTHPFTPSHKDTNVSLLAAAHTRRGSHTEVMVAAPAQQTWLDAHPSSHTHSPPPPHPSHGPGASHPGGPSRSPAASPSSSRNLRGLPGDGGWPFPGVLVTCPENRGHDTTGGGLPSQAHHPRF